MKFGFYIDQSRCIGCRTCQMACKDYKRTDTGQNFRRVYEYSGGSTVKAGEGDVYHCTAFAYYASVSCNHCENPVCLKVCPTGAIVKSRETGIVSIDMDRCIGCKSCAMACPYGSPQFNERKGVMEKCNGCAERLAVGKRPICVESCPNRALDGGDVDELRKKYNTTLNSVAPLVSGSLTSPNLCIRPSRDAQQTGSSAGKLLFPLIDEEVPHVR